MRLLFCGDIIGRPGRSVVCREIPGLRRELVLDLVVVNGENAAGGFGITGKICGELYAAGVDVITTGNHAWDQREALVYIETDPRLLRPANFPKGTPGAGTFVHRLPDGRGAAIVNLMGRLYMDPLDDPFAALDDFLGAHRLGGGLAAILVDIHAEATSEKMAIGHLADGRASAVIGTHTHIPTADAQILPGGTGYQTDAGMCGDYDSVIGMQKGPSLTRFIRKIPGERQQVAEGEGTLCGTFVETDDATGLARRIEAVRIGPRLSPALPTS